MNPIRKLIEDRIAELHAESTEDMRRSLDPDLSLLARQAWLARAARAEARRDELRAILAKADALAAVASEPSGAKEATGGRMKEVG